MYNNYLLNGQRQAREVSYLFRNLVEKISILGGWVGEGKGEEFATKVPAVKIFKMCVGRLTFNT